jgi:CrcB protein
MSVQNLIWVGLGGFFGAIGRFTVGEATRLLVKFDFPLGTLTVNVIGSFGLGLVATLLFQLESGFPRTRLFVLTGLFGSFTTFSTFSYESLELARNGRTILFFSNVAANVLFCIMGAYLGVRLVSTAL